MLVHPCSHKDFILYNVVFISFKQKLGQPVRAEDCVNTPTHIECEWTAVIDHERANCYVNEA